MPRDRYQRGWVEETGKHIKKWKGHYYVYERQIDGSERRCHRAVILSNKAELKKWEAEKKLQAIIERATAQGATAKVITFQWFWENRYKPMRTGLLKRSALDAIVWVVDKHLAAHFGDRSLDSIQRHECQMFLNGMVEKKLSHSSLDKARTYLKAILAEAVEQGFIPKNPAAKLELPDPVQGPKKFLTDKQIGTLVSRLYGRDRLILRLFLSCGFRPGELFGLRWNDWENGRLRVDEAVWRGEMTTPKTAASIGYVVLPPSVETELKMWKAQISEPQPDAFIFPSDRGTPMFKENWLNRHLRPVAETAKLWPLNYQVFRRTFATIMQKFGTVKDAQAQLRHSSPRLTAGTYMQVIPESVVAAVEEMDRAVTDWMREAEKNPVV